ncbi:MAG: hypothetical protein V1740_01215 [Candidatus Woesearchaeota archaeon]
MSLLELFVEKKKQITITLVSLILLSVIIIAAAAIWDINKVQYHDAKDVKIKLNNTYISLQDMADNNLDEVWVDSEHEIMHESEDIKVKIGEMYYSLQDIIDARVNLWRDSDHTVKHSAENIKIRIDSVDYSLQESIESLLSVFNTPNYSGGITFSLTDGNDVDYTKSCSGNAADHHVEAKNTVDTSGTGLESDKVYNFKCKINGATEATPVQVPLSDNDYTIFYTSQQRRVTSFSSLSGLYDYDNTNDDYVYLVSLIDGKLKFKIQRISETTVAGFSTPILGALAGYGVWLGLFWVAPLFTIIGGFLSLTVPGLYVLGSAGASIATGLAVSSSPEYQQAEKLCPIYDVPNGPFGLGWVGERKVVYPWKGLECSIDVVQG